MPEPGFQMDLSPKKPFTNLDGSSKTYVRSVMARAMKNKAWMSVKAGTM